MTTKTTLRRCAGSTRFGIEAHEAPISEFPRPSDDSPVGQPRGERPRLAR